MVLGLRSKNRKGTTIHVDYIIHIQEIKPWPPSQSLKSLRSVVLSWENGDRNSGSTNPVAPSLGSTAAEGKIEFNESFKLKVGFLKEGSTKGNDSGTFQKNVLELNLYEPRRDKTKGQHLGSAAVDLAELGILKESVTVGAPVSCKRSFRNNSQPVLYLRIQQFDRDGSTSSRESLHKEVSMDKDGKESVSVLMNEEYAEEAEIASFTDDDDEDESSHSSLSNSSPTIDMNANLPVQSSNGVKEHIEGSRRGCNEETSIQLESEPAKEEIIPETVDSHLSGATIDQNRCEPQLMLVDQPNNPEVSENYGTSLPSSQESRRGCNEETSIQLESEPAKEDFIPERVDSHLSGATIDQNRYEPQLMLVGQPNNPEVSENCDTSLPSSQVRNSAIVLEKSEVLDMHLSSSSVISEILKKEIVLGNIKEDRETDYLVQEVQEKKVQDRSKEDAEENTVEEENTMEAKNMDGSLDNDQIEKQKILNNTEPESNVEKEEGHHDNINTAVKMESSHGSDFVHLEKDLKEKQMINELEVETKNHSIEKDVRAQEYGNGSAEINHASDFMNLEKDENQTINGSEVKRENHSVEVQQTTDHPDSLSVVSVTNVDQNTVFEQKNFLQNSGKMSFQSNLTSSTLRFPGVRPYSSLGSDRAKNIKFSVRSPSDVKRSITRKSSDQSMEDVKEIDFQGDVRSRRMSGTEDGMDDQESTSSSPDDSSTINSNGFSSNRVRELELKIELLEGELREAASVEIGLYSITAEHGSSSQKVHTPARRISRLYLHGLKHWSKERRASVARSATSGLVLVARACGNDVPRLTFWLSNSVVLRTIVSQATKLSEIGGSNDPYSAEGDPGRMSKRKSATLRWESIYRKKGRKGNLTLTEEFDHLEDPDTFISALEKIENWIFSRIVESIWWQTFTPQMQSTTESNEPKIRSHMKKSYGKALTTPDQEHANFSMEIWKKAFKDASERLCPLRAGRHQCGCLPILPRLVMEQCISRLDVAMFNAILRESDDEIPTDPTSDPISDPNVLPVSSGKLSFGAGAQLKNTIGNWSRWLTDLLGLDEDEQPRIKSEQDDDRLDVSESLKYFHLLSAFSDLLMLPKDMLLERSIRKEVCPTFSPSIIKRILDSFLPDEFCPDLVPGNVLEALESEGHLENSEDGIRNVPCNASPVVYSPPSVDLVLSIIGDVATPSLRRSGSSLIRKSYTSDDELQELMDSPLASIVEMSSTSTAKSKQKNSSHAVRYQLLHEVWQSND
ncbi:uncharacterized protein [Typha angustifolia]|uniref:uncharacterized protein isoform X1 n=1 Tax=Typha angustifolia TaxID=59011 RepID=UPI003C2F5A79